MKKKKTNNRKANAILTGDWHLMENTPVCRTDNFIEETQWKKVQFVSELQKKHNCPVWHSGDLFEFWKPSPSLLSKAIEFLPDMFMTIYGNHDLPQHNLDLAYKTGIYTLEKAGVLQVLPGTHWGQELKKATFMKPYAVDNEKFIAICHLMTFQGVLPYPGCKDMRATGLLNKHKEFDLILTGHNHIPFVEKLDGRLLVNPGSIFRTTAAQQKHKPRVYLWFAGTNTVEPVYIPIEEDVISREHIEVKQERDDRIGAFIEAMDTDWTAKLSFEENIELYRQQNNMKKPVYQIIKKAIDYEKETN